MGIVASLVGPAIELGKCFAEPIKRQFNYLCCYNSNIQNLRDEARKLKNARDGLQRRVNTAENNAEVILPEVETWLKDVDEIQEKTTGFLSEITNIQSGFVTTKSRFSLSKKAKKAAEAMKELRSRCNFNPISYAPPLEPIPLGTTYEFESRKHIEEEIMTTLRVNNINTIGICGMGGVGKTTMAKRVMHRAREEHLFDETVMVVISQQVDMLKIQNEIAAQLGLALGESARAQKLYTRLVGRKRILIILDDVWENLKFEDLGIPCNSGLKGCTVLLTSRNSKIFNAMNVEKVYPLTVLSEREAWFLFKSNVGTCIDEHNVSFVAKEVAKECKGLPIALVTVGVALKGQKNISVWKDALQQLKTSNPKDMPEVIEDVYRPLRLSYEFLKSEHAKSLFLLCCLFAEDHDISVSHLTFYAMGLHMLEGIRNLEQARNRTCTLVEMLKSRFLLLDTQDKYDRQLDDNYVRMHDVVRDIAIFIASEERHIIKYIDCTWISSYHLEERDELLMGQNQNLRLLLIDNTTNKEIEINKSLFEGTRELNVLAISDNSLRSLPHTTQLLKNLRTLILDSCKSLETISVVGELVSLEILMCYKCSSIEELPLEIKKLNQLKLLEFTDCSNLQTIAPGVISSLMGLEELKMFASFDKWEADDEGMEREYASLNELQSLSSLKRLEIDIKDYTLAAQNIRLSSNIENYYIRIGIFKWSFLLRHTKTMHLALEREITLGNWVHKFLRNTESLKSEGDGSRNLLQTQFRNLKWLLLMNCSTVQRVVNVTASIDDGRYGTNTVFPVLENLQLDHLDNLEEICDSDGTISSNSFKNLKELVLVYLPALKHLWKSSHQNQVVPLCNNLTFISIYQCHSLHNLFLLSVAMAKDCLLQLEKLVIWDCKMMEQVVLMWNEEENDNIGPESRYHCHVTLFPKLKILKLLDLPNLRAFCEGITFPLPTQTEIRDCPKLQSDDRRNN